MHVRNDWLFPLMVMAAGSVTVFGCIGIAAITGYLPLAKVSPAPFAEPRVIYQQKEISPALEFPKASATVVLTAGAHSTNLMPAADEHRDKSPPPQKKATP